MSSSPGFVGYEDVRAIVFRVFSLGATSEGIRRLPIVMCETSQDPKINDATAAAKMRKMRAGEKVTRHVWRGCKVVTSSVMRRKCGDVVGGYKMLHRCHKNATLFSVSRNLEVICVAVRFIARAAAL